MAYAAVASLSQTIDIVLNYHQRSISPQLRDQIKPLHKHMKFLESFIEDDPDRAKNWEETIREATDRAEDIIELLLSDSLLESTVGSSKTKLERGNCEVHHDFNELEGVTEEIESIASRLKGGRRSEAVGVSDDEVMNIISRLHDGSPALEIIPIVGVGGMGKTTLARNAYNHPLIVEHFVIRAWVTISSDYDPRQILLHLVHCLTNRTIFLSDYELVIGARRILQCRYLIVLDNIADWNTLKWIFPDMRDGSRIILTTRSFELAKSAGQIHEMRFLDEDTTWNLFRENIFQGDPCPSQLERVGKMIARRCRGHLLSIQLVSGILAADQTEAAWEDISDDMHIASQDIEILSLSYTYLPHHLRPCFLYLGCFPQGREINVSKLIKLWVAEGFLKERECKSFAESGEEHVEDLVRRNLVSVRERRFNGRIKSITVHDLIQDLCQREAHKENFNHHAGTIHMELYQSCRRVSNSTYDDDFLRGIYGSTIRTIILSLYGGRLSIKSIGNVRLLRILDLSNSYEYDFIVEVFKLFHLRYLAFHSEFSISEAISNLQNLQTLIICPSEDGRRSGKFPVGIWKLPQLRHLLVFLHELPSPEGTMSALENLQTLTRVVDFICSQENLKKIPNLEKLSLFYTNKLSDVVEDYELNDLIYLQKLENLKIDMDWRFRGQHKMINAFPPTLKKLNLTGIGLPWEDMKVVSSLPNLQVLKLRKNACIGERWETSEGGFSQLTYLLIEECDLTDWITESSHFPKLKCIVLRCCLHLFEVPNDIGEIPTLELIQIDARSYSLLSSAEWIQKQRQSLGEDHLQICVKAIFLVEIPEDIGDIPTLEFIEVDDYNSSVLGSAKTRV